MWVLAGTTLGWGGGPILLYAVFRLTGVLPSQGVWAERGGNYGPWGLGSPYETLGLFVDLGVIALPLLSVATVAVTVGRTMAERRLSPCLAGLIIVLLQWALPWYFIRYLYWVTD